jgi:hypothetical protein
MMVGKRVRYSSRNQSLHIERMGDVLLMDGGHAFGPLEILAPASLTSLRSAMAAVYADYHFRGEDSLSDLPLFYIEWSPDPQDGFDDDLSLAEPISLTLMRDGRLLLEVIVSAGPPPRTEEDRWPEGLALLQGWLSSRNAELVGLAPGGLGFRWYWTIQIAMRLRGSTVLDAQCLGSDAIKYLEAHAEGILTLEGLIGLLRSGYATSLIGTSEGQLLEVKRSLHLEDEKGRLELAKDVSAIANTTSGGVLMVGLATRRLRGRDVIASIHPASRTGQERRIRSVLDRHIYPPIQALEVLLAPTSPEASLDEHVVVVVIPPQPRELLPFLVKGVVDGPRVLGSYIGLFERRGEDTMASAPASIHAGLSAGLALLRGSMRPPVPP